MSRGAPARTLVTGCHATLDSMRLVLSPGAPKQGRMVIAGKVRSICRARAPQLRGKSCTTARATAINSTASRMMRSELLSAGHDR